MSEEFKKIIDELNKKFHEYATLMQDHEKAIDAIAKLPYVPTKEAIINDLRKERNKADEKMKEYYNAVIALRKVCTHMLPNNFCAFVSAGENDDHTIEVCSICGTEIRRKNI